MSRPQWLSTSLYPFEANYVELPEGTIHYVDEGSGEPIVCVHGTPTWSFLYRSILADLSDEYRVIAPDNLGFGLSAKPSGASYRPEDHARRLTEFLDRLELDRFTLAVHDFGGPIGLPYAIRHPETINRVVLFNSWCWSLRGNWAVRLADLIARGPVGRLFYRRFNGSPRFLLQAAWGSGELTAEVHRHYTGPFPSPHTRIAPWVLAKELLGSSEWYDSWWTRMASISATPTLVLWGLADPTFGQDALDRWTHTLANATVVCFPDVGHFVPDEAGDRVTEAMRNFFHST